MTTELPGPFTLTEREQAEVDQARLETNPELYPDSRTAILTAAIERAVRTPRSVPVPGPFVLTEQEQDDFERLFRADYDDRQRRARCRAALDRAVRTLGPASGQWAEVVVDRPSSADDKPDESYKQGFSDGFARGVEYGRRLAKLSEP